MNPMTDPNETKRTAQPVRPEPPGALAWPRSRCAGVRNRKAEVALRLLRGEALVSGKNPTTKETLTILAPLPHEFEVALKYLRKCAA